MFTNNEVFQLAFYVSAGWVAGQLVRDIVVSTINIALYLIMHKKQSQAMKKLSGGN